MDDLNMGASVGGADNNGNAGAAIGGGPNFYARAREIAAVRNGLAAPVSAAISKSDVDSIIGKGILFFLFLFILAQKSNFFKHFIFFIFYLLFFFILFTNLVYFDKHKQKKKMYQLQLKYQKLDQLLKNQLVI